MLSNKVGDTELNHRSIVTMGDTLGELRSVGAAVTGVGTAMSTLRWLCLYPWSCSACVVGGVRRSSDQSWGPGTSIGCSCGNTWSSWAQGRCRELQGGDFMSMLAPCKSLNWPCSGSPSSTIELKPPEIKSRNWGKYTKNKDKGGTRAERQVGFALLCELEGLQSKDDHVVMSQD